MTEIRTKDKIFLIVAVPAALVAAYLYFWRIPASDRIGKLEEKRDSLVSVEDFPSEKLRAERRLDAARRALEAERAIPPPAEKVKASPDASPAARESAVLKIFASCGLCIVKSSSETPSSSAPSAAASALRATGFRPDPILRNYVLDGSYPAVRRALDEIASERLAVIPERVEMRDAERGRWTLSLWL